MNKETVEVYHALAKKGWIDREENKDVWAYYEMGPVQDELETMGEGLHFNLVRSSSNRVYKVATQGNDLILKNNIDYRKDISANNEVRTRDLYLMNYFSIYFIYMFYHGEGTDPKCREFISRDDAIKEFSDHCRTCLKGAEEVEQTDYSDNFIQLANAWLSKTDGPVDSLKFNEHYGILNRLLVKFNAEHDDLFYLESGNIRPTRKLDDLMPYFLRKERIAEIQKWISEVETNATDI